MANEFDTMHLEEERIWSPSGTPNTLFTPSLPCLSSLKMLVAPEYEEGSVQLAHNEGLPLEETTPLQASMGLNNDIATFVKLILMFAEAAAENLDLSKGYFEQSVVSKTLYVTEIARRFPKFEHYFVDAWPAYAFAKIYLDQFEAREERRKKQQAQAERIQSIVNSVCELLQLQPDRPQNFHPQLSFIHN